MTATSIEDKGRASLLPCTVGVEVKLEAELESGEVLSGELLITVDIVASCSVLCVTIALPVIEVLSNCDVVTTTTLCSLASVVYSNELTVNIRLLTSVLCIALDIRTVVGLDKIVAEGEEVVLLNDAILLLIEAVEVFGILLEVTVLLEVTILLEVTVLLDKVLGIMVDVLLLIIVLEVVNDMRLVVVIVFDTAGVTSIVLIVVEVVEDDDVIIAEDIKGVVGPVVEIEY